MFANVSRLCVEPQRLSVDALLMIETKLVRCKHRDEGEEDANLWKYDDESVIPIVM